MCILPYAGWWLVANQANQTENQPEGLVAALCGLAEGGGWGEVGGGRGRGREGGGGEGEGKGGEGGRLRGRRGGGGEGD